MPDHRHGQQGVPEPGRRPHVAQALADLPLGPGHHGALVELGGAHHEEGDQDGHVGRGIEQEARGQADGVDEDAADGGADHPGGVHDDAVEADGVGQEVAADHFGHEGLASRVVEQVDHAEQGGDQVDLPHGDGAQRHQDAEDEGQHAGCGLGDVEEATLVDPVDDEAAPAAEQQHRQELQGRDETDVEPVPVELVGEDQQAEGDGVHPGAGRRDDLADEEEAVVADAQRLKGLAGRPRDRAQSSATRCSRRLVIDSASCCSAGSRAASRRFR